SLLKRLAGLREFEAGCLLSTRRPEVPIVTARATVAVVPTCGQVLHRRKYRTYDPFHPRTAAPSRMDRARNAPVQTGGCPANLRAGLAGLQLARLIFLAACFVPDCLAAFRTGCRSAADSELLDPVPACGLLLHHFPFASS